MRLWPDGGLWRHGDFLHLWGGQTISQFGTQIGQLAIPLAAILVLAGSSETAVEGALLLAVYSLGLAIPFVLVGAAFTRSMGAFRWLRDHYRAIQFTAVVETNHAALALWRSLGFAVVGTVPEAFDHPEHGLVGLHVMHRRLG